MTQHLAAVCTASTSSITFKATTSFASLFGGTPPANFHGFSGSGGVQGGITGNSLSIGYLSPDFTQIAPINAGTPGFPPVATVKNASDGTFYLPTATNSNTALSSAPAPSNPADPTQYVPAVATPAHGYPIAGFTTWDVAQCYVDNNVASGVSGFLLNMMTNPALANLLLQNGFSLLPNSLLGAITDHLIFGDAADPKPLDIQDPTVCQAAGASGSGTFAGR
jgi:ABC-type phosphate transport system substrate-binding protein